MRRPAAAPEVKLAASAPCYENQDVRGRLPGIPSGAGVDKSGFHLLFSAGLAIFLAALLSEM